MPSEPITATALRDEARRIRARAEAQARALEDAAAELEHVPLPPGSVVSHGAKVAAGRSAKRWPWRSRLDSAGLSVPEWALRAHVAREVAKGWLKAPGHGGRAIPRQWADRLADEFVAPELRRAESWPCGIRE